MSRPLPIIPRRIRMPMTYQTKLFIAIGIWFLALAAASLVGLAVTATSGAQKFPDIIAEQPDLNK